MSQQIRSTKLQHLLAPTHTYRPIAPSIAPPYPKEPSLEEISEQNKRKRSSTQPDPSSTDHLSSMYLVSVI